MTQLREYTQMFSEVIYYLINLWMVGFIAGVGVVVLFKLFLSQLVFWSFALKFLLH